MSPTHSADMDFDPLSPSFFSDPTEIYRVLRETAPLYYDERLGIWVVARHPDVAAALLDWETFSSARGVTLHQVLDKNFDGSNVMMMIDPPQHTRLRSLVSRAFTPRAIGGSEPLIRSVVRRFLDTLSVSPRFDAVSEFADPFPAEVICRLVGVPGDDAQQINNWISTLLHRNPGDPAMTPEGMQAAIDSGRYFSSLQPTDEPIQPRT